MSAPLTITTLNAIKAAGGIFKHVGEAFDDVIKGMSNMTRGLAIDPNGDDITPAPISQVQAQHLGNGMMNVAIVDPSPVARGVNYYVEYAPADAVGNPSFVNPQVVDLGASRNATFVVPNGKYYVRAYSQNPAGGPPSKPIMLATPISVSNSATLPLLPSQSSGTGQPFTGGGHGAGKNISR